MGANFDARGYEGKYSFKEVISLFMDDIEESQWEDGHSYSGCIGMLDGIDKKISKVFDSHDDAYNYIEDNHQKWNGAWAAKFKDSDDPSGFGWIVGGWCSS